MPSKNGPDQGPALRRPDRHAKLRKFPPVSETVTDYDIAHSVTYLRLLDAETAGATWQEVARIVLNLDPESDAENAHGIWQKHLARAQWMRDSGYRELLKMGQSGN